MKKRRDTRNPSKVRARQKRRRRAREAAKQRRRTASEGDRVMLMGNFDGSGAHLHDDCPYCRALADVGLSPAPDGEVRMTAQQAAAYERRVAEIIAAEGLPEGAVKSTGEDLRRRAELINERLEAEGFETDLDRLDDDAFYDLMRRVSELTGELDRAERRQAQAAGIN